MDKFFLNEAKKAPQLRIVQNIEEQRLVISEIAYYRIKHDYRKPFVWIRMNTLFIIFVAYININTTIIVIIINMIIIVLENFSNYRIKSYNNTNNNDDDDVFIITTTSTTTIARNKKPVALETKA